MIPETIVLGQILAPIVASLAVIVFYHYTGSEYLGAEENIDENSTLTNAS